MKKRKRIIKVRGGKPLAILVVGSAGSSMIGSALPGTAGAPLQAVGGGLASFVGPAATVVGAGMVMNSMKHLPQPKRIGVRKMKRRYK